MALFADGCHMSTHSVALAISLMAFIFARRHAADRSFTFGTWKIEVLGGFTSGIILGIVGLFMGYVSIERLMSPLQIQYNEAMIVAVIGLVVNLASMALLNTGHHHHHDHDHEHEHKHDHGHENLNLKAAYLHVLADAMTSVFAIAALLGGKFLGWNWLDPVMGIAGAILVIRWTFSLLKDTGAILLDKEANSSVTERIRTALEADGDTRISDLHVWKVGMDKYSCIISIVASNPRDLKYYRQLLHSQEGLAHITVEISKCE
jgi:cation diffusion facilitator family transporter